MMMKHDTTTRVFDAPFAGSIRSLLSSDLGGKIEPLLLSLDWRHHGIGVLQAYLSERNGVERRVHIWHPDLVVPGIEVSGCVHDHRFDLASVVLVGSLLHRVYALRPNPEGDYETLNLVNARASNEATGSFHTEPTLTGERFDAYVYAYSIGAGHGYTFDRHAFHSSTSTELTVTVVEKRNQEGSARLLADRRYPHRNAFGNPENLTAPEQMRPYVLDAIEALRRGEL